MTSLKEITRLRAVATAARAIVDEAVGPGDPPRRGSNLERLFVELRRLGEVASKRAPDPSRCDGEIFASGRIICHFHAPKEPTEKWVQAVAAVSGQRVDWSYCGGYAGVKFIGDDASVRSAVEYLRPLLKCTAFRMYEPEPEAQG